ncbi:uncharacterized protein G2W53_026382 [Senna tora]|uniref:Uncharacterized protein n=1 Tax=Senna tora TaxID=362788 RepID=A0A834WFM0_9FABA|nr:uncharacterized protein G2W53_026382 [Senna tora]
MPSRRKNVRFPSTISSLSLKVSMKLSDFVVQIRYWDFQGDGQQFEWHVASLVSYSLLVIVLHFLLSRLLFVLSFFHYLLVFFYSFSAISTMAHITCRRVLSRCGGSSCGSAQGRSPGESSPFSISSDYRVISFDSFIVQGRDSISEESLQSLIDGYSVVNLGEITYDFPVYHPEDEDFFATSRRLGPLLLHHGEGSHDHGVQKVATMFINVIEGPEQARGFRRATEAPGKQESPSIITPKQEDGEIIQIDNAKCLKASFNDN